MGIHKTILPLDKCRGHTHTHGALKLTDLHVYPTNLSKMKVFMLVRSLDLKSTM